LQPIYYELHSCLSSIYLGYSLFTALNWATKGLIAETQSASPVQKSSLLQTASSRERWRPGLRQLAGFLAKRALRKVGLEPGISLLITMPEH
jgi:hypothetical protein